MTDLKVAVITGGAGFIGSHLADALLDKGYRVYVIDNLLTGNIHNLDTALKNPQCTFIRHDVTTELPIVGDIDFIYHLASPASVPDYQKYPEETALVNSIGTRNLLKVAKSYDAKFLFTSTSEVYGDPKVHPQPEGYWGNVNPNGVRASYDESKRFGEMLTMLYVRSYGVDGRIARIFNTYGPRMRPTDGRIVSNFITQGLSGKDITVYGDGKQTRSLCYITDMVAGLISLMEHDDTKGEVVNIGNPDEYTVLAIAEKIKKKLGSASSIAHAHLPPDDPAMRQPDIGKAKKLLGWEPHVPLDQGLENTIEYYKMLIK